MNFTGTIGTVFASNYYLKTSLSASQMLKAGATMALINGGFGLVEVALIREVDNSKMSESSKTIARAAIYISTIASSILINAYLLVIPNTSIMLPILFKTSLKLVGMSYCFECVQNIVSAIWLKINWEEFTQRKYSISFL